MAGVSITVLRRGVNKVTTTCGQDVFKFVIQLSDDVLDDTP